MFGTQGAEVPKTFKGLVLDSERLLEAFPQKNMGYFARRPSAIQSLVNISIRMVFAPHRL